jgi:ATP/maltotriose-dependent transcriptional regulator MalT
MGQTAELRSLIKLDKFYPPQVDTPQFLVRDRIIQRLLHQAGSRTPSFIIEAQAGQGKTTVIKQFLDRSEKDFVWYQVRSEDADPGFFLTAILVCINSHFPDCPSARTARILSQSELSILDMRKSVELLSNDLRACLTDDLYMVFDDLHCLLGHESSLGILNYLLETAPPRLHFILSSRERLPLNAAFGIAGNRVVQRLDNRDLAFTESEVTDFFHRVHHLDVPIDTIKAVARTTDGWIMGIALLGLQLVQQGGAASLPALAHNEGTGTQEILHYFRQQIFALLPPHLHRPLLFLSLLDEIPVALATELTGEAHIGADMCELARRNLFIRHLDPEHTEFSLHHLFRQFQQEKTAAELSPQTIRWIYQRAGQFCLHREDTAQALRYLLQAGDHAVVEAVLKDHGMAFLATNQTATLAAILQQIPQPGHGLLHIPGGYR